MINKNLLVALLLIGMILFTALLGIYCAPSSENHASPPASDVAESASTSTVSTSRPYADHPHAHAIDAGLAFVRDHGALTEPSWQVYALLDFLRRRFGLDEQYAIENTFFPENHQDYDLELMRLMERLTDPTFVPELQQIEEESNNLMRLLEQAAYCDYYPVTSAFITEYDGLCDKERALSGGHSGYIMTHAILCYQWMRELGCDSAFPELESRWPIFADELVKIIVREKAATDLGFEALAFLYYIGAGDRVQESWIEAVLALQTPEGAWKYDATMPIHGHPTALAVWALLEHALPDLPKRPWLEPRTP